jgi:hypothetical protein
MTDSILETTSSTIEVFDPHAVSKVVTATAPKILPIANESLLIRMIISLNHSKTKQ